MKPKINWLFVLNAKGNPVSVDNVEDWANQLKDEDRRVDLTKIGAIKVSTVFLGTPHGFTKTGEPILWETMILGGEHHQKLFRCSGSMEQAEAMHERAVKFVKEAK